VRNKSGVCETRPQLLPMEQGTAPGEIVEALD